MKKRAYLACALALALAAWPLVSIRAAPRCYPTSRFVVLDGGLVRDTLTNLVWQRDGSGTRTGCSGSGNLTCTWSEASAYCGALVLGGVTGFRLPTVKELRSIVDFTIAGPGPTIDQTAFPSTPSESFWTSSQYAGSSGSAWYVFFYNGASSNYDVSAHLWARCVR
jgi:hypothetical protein